VLALVPATAASVATAFVARERSDGAFELAHALHLAAGITLLTGLARALLSVSGEQERARQRAESHTNAVLATGARGEAIVRSAVDCVVVMDDQGLVRDLNPSTERTFGYSREELLGARVSELLIPYGLRDAHEAGLRRYVETGEQAVFGRRMEMPALHKDGHEFQVEIAVNPIRPVPGEKPMFLAVMHDISDRKRAEKQFRRFAAEA